MIRDMVALTRKGVIDLILGATGDLIFINSLSDLPAPVNGVIHLAAGNTYYFTGEIDLLGNRLVCDGVVTLLGTSSETSYIRSTGLHTTQPNKALISSEYSIPCQNFTFDGLNEGYPIVELNAFGNNGALDWYGVNFLNCPTMGLIRDYSNCVFVMGAVLNSANLSFDGDVGTISFDHYFMMGRAGQTTGIIKPTCRITARLRIQYSTVVTPATATGFDVQSVDCFPNPESAFLNRVNFSGSGLYLTGTLVGTNKTLFIGCNGVPNRPAVFSKYVDDNIVETVIVEQDVAVPVTASMSVVTIEKFLDAPQTEFTYDGAFIGVLSISVSATLVASANNRVLRLQIFKDTGSGFAAVEGAEFRVRTAQSGNPVTGSLSNMIVSAQPGDKFRVYIANESGTENITASELTINAYRIA